MYLKIWNMRDLISLMILSRVAGSGDSPRGHKPLIPPSFYFVADFFTDLIVTEKIGEKKMIGNAIWCEFTAGSSG